MTLEGPHEKTAEAKEIVSKKGFSYGNVLGELIFAYIICRLDIGYSFVFSPNSLTVHMKNVSML